MLVLGMTSCKKDGEENPLVCRTCETVTVTELHNVLPSAVAVSESEQVLEDCNYSINEGKSVEIVYEPFSTTRYTQTTTTTTCK